MKKILLIEDEEQHIALVKLRLERAGFSVFSAQTAVEGLAAAKLERPDLIMTDLMLPDMGAEKLLDALAATKGCEGVPLVAFTALDKFELERRNLATRFAGVIRKPYETSDLLNTIEEVLRAVTRGRGG